jgi:hypothetical protein
MAIKLTEGLNFFGGDKIRLKGKFDKKNPFVRKVCSIGRPGSNFFDQLRNGLTSSELV